MASFGHAIQHPQSSRVTVAPSPWRTKAVKEPAPKALAENMASFGHAIQHAQSSCVTVAPSPWQTKAVKEPAPKAPGGKHG
jgi:hypothetical protein